MFWNNIILWIFFLTQKYDEEFKARGLFPHLICYLIIFLNHPLKVFYWKNFFSFQLIFVKKKKSIEKNVFLLCVHIRFWLVIELEHNAINYLTNTQPFNWHNLQNLNCHNFFSDIKHFSSLSLELKFWKKKLFFKFYFWWLKISALYFWYLATLFFLSCSIWDKSKKNLKACLNTFFHLLFLPNWHFFTIF